VKSAEDDERKPEQGGQPAEEATLTESLGIFAEGVAREDVRDEAEAAVIEAAAKSVLPVSHFGSKEVLSQRVERRMTGFWCSCTANCDCLSDREEQRDNWRVVVAKE